MSNLVNKKVKQVDQRWDIVINNAKEQLRNIREREQGLLIVIARFEKFRDEGEPFPVEIQMDTTAESIPA
ncbi:MAG TPA: hypothetical protein VI636_03150 [Candidatus Angelobacter sp.]